MSVQNITHPDAVNSIDLYCRSITLPEDGGQTLEEVDNVSMAGNTFNGSVSGAVSAPIKISRIGQLVTLNIPAFNGAISGTVSSSLNLPVRFRPPAGWGAGISFYTCSSNNSGAAIVGLGIIRPSGQIQLYPNPSTSGYTTSISITPGISFTYSLNF